MNIYKPEQARRSFTRMRKENVLVKERVFYRFYHFSFAHQQVLKFWVYVYVFLFGATSKLPVLCTITAQYNSPTIQCV